MGRRLVGLLGCGHSLVLSLVLSLVQRSLVRWGWGQKWLHPSCSSSCSSSCSRSCASSCSNLLFPKTIKKNGQACAQNLARVCGRFWVKRSLLRLSQPSPVDSSVLPLVSFPKLASCESSIPATKQTNRTDARNKPIVSL